MIEAIINSIENVRTAFWRTTTPAIHLEDLHHDRTFLGPVFNGAAHPDRNEQYYVLSLPASAFEANKRYKLTGGFLAIKGDLPDDIEIEVEDGKLFLAGNTGKRNFLSAEVPVNYRERIIPPSGSDFGGAAFSAALYPEFESYKFAQDKDPALVILGHINADSQISSNHGIHVSQGFDSSVEFETKHAKHTISAGVPLLTNPQFIEQVLKAA